MDSHSKLFDSIRIKPTSGRKREAEVPQCEHPGCQEPGPHRAPKGRGQEGRYWQFCLAHVREYNASYNYFNGMGDDAVHAFQKDAMTGHRPTWSSAVNGDARVASKKRPKVGAKESATWSYDDPLGIFGAAKPKGAGPVEAPRRVLSARTLAALDTLGLDEKADPAAIKKRYKEHVKRFHPDANGGDRSFEARLQDIIKAYNALKTAGLVEAK